ncbi:MAG TPA: CHASE3 domain-containing protein, partial [Gaiellaceae bacterium]|nr:CHASE3 domain-containing protein [Gaiellaceae bacterium]
MRVRRGSVSLSARMIAASVFVALLVAGGFAVLITAMSALDDAKEREAHSKDVAVAALALETLFGDLVTGERGFILTGDQRFLQPWTDARKELDRRVNEFEELSAANPEQLRRARELSVVIREYVTYYSKNLIDVARTNRAAARGEVAEAEGKRLTDDIRQRFDTFKSEEDALAAASASSADRQSDRAIGLAVLLLVFCAFLIVLFGLYLARSTARPVRAVATAASRLAAGDLSTRLSGGGPGEVGELTTAFNRMAEELEQSRSELESQNEQLRQSERRKSELVRIVSHELRTPLASVLGFTSVLLDREVPPEEQRHYLDIVNGQARRLSSLLNDFLDAERLEEGELELSPKLIDMGAVVAEQVQLYRGQSSKHKLDAALPPTPLPVHGDPNRLAQVIGNLLSNAIKYSPDGGTVYVEAEQVDSVIRVSVRDQGLGIPDELQQRVFAKFFRGDADVSGIPGTGLGLT